MTQYKHHIWTLLAIIAASCITATEEHSLPGTADTTSPAPSSEEEPAAPVNPLEAPLPAYTPGTVSRPARRLLEQAEGAWKEGRKDQALAILNRAFRIDSASAEIPLRHSEYYLGMEQYQKVESWGKRALGARQITKDQKQRAWNLIARARYRLGDQEGANKALAEATR
jgi:predicted Zn-dependent protease